MIQIVKDKPKMFIFDTCQSNNKNANISVNGSFFEITSMDSSDGTSIESSKNGGSLVNSITQAFNDEFSKQGSGKSDDDGNVVQFDFIMNKITASKTNETKLVLKRNNSKNQSQLLTAQLHSALDDYKMSNDSKMPNEVTLDCQTHPGEPMKIFVKPPKGKPIPLTLNPNDTIAHVKDKIKDPAGIPAKHQRLLLDDEQLDDQTSIETPFKS